MNPSDLDEILSRLHGSDADAIIVTVRQVRELISSLDDASLRRAIEALSGLFYIDLYDRPDFQPAVDAAEEAIASTGEPAIPILIHLLEGSDIKCHVHLANILGRLGEPSISHLRRLIATSEAPDSRAFALYALGKIRSETVLEALPETIGSLMHPDKEVRDSAARTLGKIVEKVPPAGLDERRRTELFEVLARAIGDVQPAVRAKAVRSLGKMALHGYLDESQRSDLKTRLVALLTRGEKVDWDRAYIVRREAHEALDNLATLEAKI